MPTETQYYIVDATLGMRKGKIGAQCAHGALLADLIYQRLALLASRDEGDSTSRLEANLYCKWFEDEMTKIVLKGNPEILAKATDEFGRMAALVVDNGHTEIPAGSQTVIVLPIMLKEDAPDWVKELKLL